MTEKRYVMAQGERYLMTKEELAEKISGEVLDTVWNNSATEEEVARTMTKVYTLARLAEIAEEYIGETEHGGAGDPPATWQEAIRDFVIALEHW